MQNLPVICTDDCFPTVTNSWALHVLRRYTSALKCVSNYAIRKVQVRRSDTSFILDAAYVLCGSRGSAHGGFKLRNLPL